MSTLNNICCGLLRSVVLLSIVSASVDFSIGRAAGQATPAGPAATAPAQPGSYRELVVDDTTKWNQTVVGQTRSKVAQILRAHTFAQGEKSLFDDYYLTYVLARWSLVENVGDLPNQRQLLQRDFRNAGSGAVYDHLNSLILNFLAILAKPGPTDSDFVSDQFLSALANPDAVDPNMRTQIGNNLKFEPVPAVGDCHPAVRINAMFTIGRLNATLPTRAADLPTPLPAALRQVLLPTLADPKQIDGVKVAALLGVLRHAKLGGITGADVAAVSSEMLKQLSPTLPQGRSAVGHAWIRARAAEVLGELKVTGANGAVPAALAAVIAERTSPLSVRCAAAKALGRFNLAGVGGVNAPASTTALGQLALDACRAEAKAAGISRARLTGHLHAVSAGLTVLAPLNAASVTKVKTPITTILGHLDNRRLIDDFDLMEKVKEELPKLSALLSNQS